MADPAVVKEWLDKADEDFLFAEANLREGSGFYAQLCFHFQQAAEKYLKAYIIGNNLPFGRVHDLVYLLRTCAAHAPEFGELKEEDVWSQDRDRADLLDEIKKVGKQEGAIQSYRLQFGKLSEIYNTYHGCPRNSRFIFYG